MSASGASGAASPGGEGSGGGAAPPGGALVHHPRSFKLRFAAQREPGRSYVSSVKPLGLPATVTGKFYARPQPAAADGAAGTRRIRDMFERGPRDKYAAPLTTAQEYGWWRAEAAAAAGAGAASLGLRRRTHHLRDSAWMKARLLVLAADARLRAR